MPQSVSETSLVSNVSPIHLESSEIVLRDDEDDTILDFGEYACANREVVNLENAAVNIDNSNDVIIGPVTQFNVNGNVTIYQNGTAEGTETVNGAIRDKSGETKTTTSSDFQVEQLPLGHWINILYISRRNIQYLGILLFVLLVCMVIALILIQQLNDEADEYDNKYNESRYGDHLENHTVYYRNDWGGKPPKVNTIQLKHPVPLVIISHSSPVTCDSFEICSDLVKKTQKEHFSNPYRSCDIGYNFLIGGDGNIYVGRGWDIENFHKRSQSIGISFIGNFNYDVLSDDMVDAAESVIHQGLQLGKLSEQYRLVGENQTNSKAYLSPGVNVYKVIKNWPHFFSRTML